MTIKTTIELPEPLFVQAKRYAAERSMTLKALIEQGLRGAMARLGQVETAAADVDQRLERAMNVVGAVIARVEAQQPPEPEADQS